MKEQGNNMARSKRGRRVCIGALMSGVALAGSLFMAAPAYASFLDSGSLQMSATTGQVALGAQVCPSASDHNHDQSGSSSIVRTDEQSDSDCGEYPHGSVQDVGAGPTAWALPITTSEADSSGLPGFTSTVQFGPIERPDRIVGGTIPVELSNTGTLPIRTVELQALDAEPANLDVTVSLGGQDVVSSEPLSTLVAHPVSLLISPESLGVGSKDLLVISLTRHHGRPSEDMGRQGKQAPTFTFEVTGSDQ